MKDDLCACMKAIDLKDEIEKRRWLLFEGNELTGSVS